MIKYATSPKKHRAWGANTAARWHVWKAPIGLLALVLVVLAGCGEPYCGGTAQHPTIIHVPGVQTVSAMTSYLDVFSGDVGYGTVEGITPLSDSDSTQYVLITVAGAVYVLNLTESEVDPIDGLTCLGPAALAPDHLHLACITPNGFSGGIYCTVLCDGPALTYVTLSAVWPPSVALQHTFYDSNSLFSSPTWSPDSHHFAVLHRRIISGICTIDFESPVEDGTNFAETGELSLSSFDACDARQLSWAPDGHALLVATNTTLALVPVNRIPSALFTLGIATVTPEVITSTNSILGWTVWSADSRSLTVLDESMPTAIQSVDVTSHAIRMLLALPAGSVGSVGPFVWTPQGDSLLFAFGPRQSPQDTSPSTAPTSSAQLELPVACADNMPQTIMYAYTPPKRSPGG